MIKKTTILTLIAASALPAAAAITGQWRLHPSFDNSIVKVLDTPTRTYFMGYPQSYNASVSLLSMTDCSLFFYDKEGDEMLPAAATFDMSSATMRSMAYNPEKEYLLVSYANSDIDLLHDDGSVSNIGALKNATLPGSKGINGISFDAGNDRAWIATDFGYIAINDERMEVSESRNYGKSLRDVVRLGDELYINDGSKWLHAPVKDARMKLADYTVTDFFTPETTIYPMTEERFLICEPHADNSYRLTMYDIKGDSFEEVRSTNPNYVTQIQPSKRGYTIVSYSALAEAIADTGWFEFAALPDDEKGNKYSAAWEFKEFFAGKPRKGLRSFSYGSDKKYALSRDYMMPNAPNAFISRNMAWHPRYGMLVSTFGTDNIFNNNETRLLNLLSGLKNGEWTSLGTVYRNPKYTNTGMTPRGIVVDPDNDRYIYVGSSFSGLTRMNLDDPEDLIHFTHPKDADASTPIFYKLIDTEKNWERVAALEDPAFDSEGNLWLYHFNYDNPDKLVFLCWPAANRRATTNAASVRPWLTLTKNLPDFSQLIGKFLPLKAGVNKNLLLFMSDNGLVVIDHNGTPENGSDDKVTTFTKLTDQDGNVLSLRSPDQLWEDPQTGTVWVSGNQGILYCTPRNLLQGQGILNRVKISRNDGTSLADYLLNGVEVSGITRDGENRMWIGTLGSGVVVTSSDGKTVYQEFNSGNSELPADNIYSIAYNPTSESMVISTDKGICEFFIGSSSQSGNADNGVRAYPNPVAPDYYGWITIDGLPDNSLVKIVDAKGNLVRELGRAQGGSIQWDANNLHYRRVQTGVYYILASPGSESGGESRVGKILVMN